jgi:hypothetical protein
MGKNLDQINVDTQEQFANETKSASDVVRPLRNKPITYSHSQND